MGNNLKKLRELKNWTHDEAAAAMGMSRGGFIKLERGERLLDEDSVRNAAEVFEVTRGVVLGEQTPIRIMGRVGAGGSIEPDFEQVPPDGLSTIELPFPVPDGIDGLEVEGESMIPAYRPGDVILVWRDQRRPTIEYIGEECAVLTTTGYRALKVLQRGRSARLFDLTSHNALPKQDVAIEWVGEIYLVIKARQISLAVRTKAADTTRRTNRRRRETQGMTEFPFEKPTKKVVKKGRAK